MANTILTYTATGNAGPTAVAQVVTRLQQIFVDLTVPQLYGLLLISDTIASAAPQFTRVIVAQMTPTIADAAGTAVMGGNINGAVQSVTMTNQGGLYGAPPVVTFAGGNPTNAAQGFAQCQVRGCNVLLQGAGYNGPTTTVAFIGGLAVGGVPATGTATVAFGAVTGIVMTNTGGPYLQAPLVVITDSSGGGAGAEVVAGLSVSGVGVTSGGQGYGAVPNVVFTPLFKQMCPDSAGNAEQESTLWNWMDLIIQNPLNIPINGAVVAS